MAKAIKFNLMMDGKPIRNLEGLRDHFNIDDLLEYYENGILQRWLKVRQKESLADKIDKIAESDEIKKAQALIETLWLPIEEHKLKEAVYHLVAKREKERQLQLLDQKLMKEREIIRNYHEEYTKICESLKNKKEDYPFIKSQLQRVADEFYELFEIHYSDFYFSTIKNNPLCFFSVISNSNLRWLFIDDSEIMKNISEFINKNILLRSDQGTQKKNAEQEKNETETDYRLTQMDINDIVRTYEMSGCIDGCNFYSCDTRNVQISKIDFKGSEKIVILSSDPPSLTSNSVDPLAGRIVEKNDNVLRKMSYRSFGYKFDYVPFDDLKKMVIKKLREKDKRKQKKEQERKLARKREISKPSYIDCYSGITDSYWKDLEPKEKKCLVIHMEPGNYVRSVGKINEELSADDVNGKFPILDGIDYKSNNADHVLYYMEV